MFRGATTGEMIKNKTLIGRGQLMNMSLSEEETMEIWFSRVVDGNDAILKHLPLNK